MAARTDIERHLFKRDWTASSEYDKHSRLNNHHTWGDLYDHLMSTSIFTLIMSKIFI